MIRAVTVASLLLHAASASLFPDVVWSNPNAILSPATTGATYTYVPLPDTSALCLDGSQYGKRINYALKFLSERI